VSHSSTAVEKQLKKLLPHICNKEKEKKRNNMGFLFYGKKGMVQDPTSKFCGITTNRPLQDA